MKLKSLIIFKFPSRRAVNDQVGKKYCKKMVLSKQKQFKISPRKLKYIIVASVLVILIVIAVTLVLVLRPNKFKGAVVTNGPECSAIAKNIFIKGGNVADAAIAALFCEGVAMPQYMGLGGGFLLTIYIRASKTAISLNSREVAPKSATQDMFGGDSSLSVRGGLSVAVPGELRGYWELYNKFGGGVSWNDLIQPTIELCKNGIRVSDYMAKMLKNNKRNKVLADPLISEIFINPKTKDVYVEGDSYTLPRLAKTLEIIAAEGGNAIHNGSLTAGLVRDIQNHQGIITEDDLMDYRPKWENSLTTTLSGGHYVYTQPLPGSGTVLTLILNILDNFLDRKQPEIIDNYQKIVESFKFAYAKRTLLGDPDFVDVAELVSNFISKEYAEKLKNLISLNSTENNPGYYGTNTSLPEDHGTANLCILAPNGDAITVTSTINHRFGAGFVSESTGIILNDEMDDFSSDNIFNAHNLHPSPATYIKAGKQPMSSMSPTIIVNEVGDVEMLVGAAGGSKIISSIVQIIVRHLWYGTELNEATDTKRIHHQLWPMTVQLEPAFAAEDIYITEGLKKIGHNVSFADGQGFAAATCITSKDGESVSGSYDRRRSGSVSYL